MITTIQLVLLVVMVLAAIWTVMTSRLLHSAIGLAVTSVVLAVLMYQLGSPLAAVFELSVCAGLISAIFICAISLTKRITTDDISSRRKERLHRFWVLPLILLVAGIAMISMPFGLSNICQPPADSANDVRNILWNQRHLDLIGQIAILLAGAFGVVALFKESKNDR
jgi:NADH-quinone oxidoreductase subunit J